MRITPKRLRTILNFYPPYIGAGIHVDNIADDWRQIDVSMRLRWYNRNAVRTHFGGSLYSMVDPHLMLMLMQLLGREYIVWDKSAEKTDALIVFLPGLYDVAEKFKQENFFSMARTAGIKADMVAASVHLDHLLENQLFKRIEKDVFTNKPNISVAHAFCRGEYIFFNTFKKLVF